MVNLMPRMVFFTPALGVLLFLSAVTIPSSLAIEVEVIVSLPFSAEGDAPTHDDPDFFSFTPAEDMSTVIDTCGSDTYDGIDTVLRIYKRIDGANSNTDITLSDFELLEENDNNWPLNCPSVAGKIGSNYDSVITMDLSADVQYLISVTPHENYIYEAQYQLSMSLYVIIPPPPPQPPQPPYPPIQGLDATIIDSLPYQVQNMDITYAMFDWYSFTPTQNITVVIDTCGSPLSTIGMESGVFVWRRMVGENSDTYIKLSEFWFTVVTNGGGDKCDELAGKEGLYEDVAFTTKLQANVQYLIRVGVFTYYEEDEGLYNLGVSEFIPSPPSPPPPPMLESPPYVEPPLMDVVIIESLPFSIHGIKSFAEEDEWFSFTPTESVSVVIDTCGSKKLPDGLVTSLYAYERVEGANSNTDIKLSEFGLLPSQFKSGSLCDDVAGKPGSLADSVITLQLTGNLQYLVWVGKYGKFAATSGYYNIAVAEYSLPPPPSPPLPESPPLQLPAPVLLGDMNGDGMVDVGDAITLAYFIFDGVPDDFPFSSADLKMDGMLNVLDIVELANMIVGL